MKKRIQYPKEFKARVALEALKEVKTIAELSSEHEVHSAMISKWKKQLHDNIADIFIRKNEQEPDAKQQIENLYKEIGRIQVENSEILPLSRPKLSGSKVVFLKSPASPLFGLFSMNF